MAFQKNMHMVGTTLMLSGRKPEVFTFANQEDMQRFVYGYCVRHWNGKCGERPRSRSETISKFFNKGTGNTMSVFPCLAVSAANAAAEAHRADNELDRMRKQMARKQSSN